MTLDCSEASQSSAPTLASSHAGDFPLQKAAREGNLQACETLIDAGCPVNQVDAEGWTPLRAAAWAGHLQIVQLLLKKGAGVDFCDEGQGGRTALVSFFENSAGISEINGSKKPKVSTEFLSPIAN